MDLSKTIRDIPNYPVKGVLFRDITTLLKDSLALKFAIDEFQKRLEGLDFDVIVGPESRGFIFGMPLAYNMEKGFIPIRKAGKLPAETISVKYSLEYGQAELEIHLDAIKPGQKVVVVDDLIATGGTSRAITQLIEKAGGEIVSMIYLIELLELKGREVIGNYNIHSIIEY